MPPSPPVLEQPSASWMIAGQVAARGVAIGQALLWQHERLLKISGIKAEAVTQETQRLVAAFTHATKTLDQLLIEKNLVLPSEVNALVEMHIQILSDSSILEDCEQRIADQLINAEAALQMVERDIVAQFDAMENEYLRTRSVDVQQALSKVYDILADEQKTITYKNKPFVLFAEDISVTDLVQLPRILIKGMVLSNSTINAHIAIVARDWGIPALINTKSGHLLVNHEEDIILDAEMGMVWGNPPKSALTFYHKKIVKSQEHKTLQQQLSTKPAVTLDGVAITVKVNIDGYDEGVQNDIFAHSDGIGLFRTELLFMAHHLPSEELQSRVYTQLLSATKGKPCRIRTFDNGVDKPFSDNISPQPSFSQLGLRSTRFALAQPHLLRTQFRALLKASPAGRLEVLIPMLSHQEQVVEVCRIWESVKKELKQEGVAFARDVRLGAMVEVPGALALLRHWPAYFDFVSVGSNDLVQYLLAADRLDKEVSHLYTSHHPMVIFSLAYACRFNRHKHRQYEKRASYNWVSLCGSLAGEVEWCRPLLVLGLRDFSMASSQVAEVKYTIAHTDLSALKKFRKDLLAADSSTGIQQVFEAINRL